MLKSSDMFYLRLKEYQDKRHDITSAYDDRMEQIKSAAGSKYYEAERKKALNAKESALRALRDEYGRYLQTHLDAMRSANKQRKNPPVSTDILNKLQILKMKDKPTQAELDDVAREAADCPLALSALTEIAHKAGFMRGYTSEGGNMTVEGVENSLKGLFSSTRDFLDYDSPKAARIVRDRYRARYGTEGGQLPKRARFETKQQCFEEMGIPSNSLQAFCDAVDAE